MLVTNGHHHRKYLPFPRSYENQNCRQFGVMTSTAQGNFPGPCRIFFHGPLNVSVAAVKGYSAFALPDIVRSGGEVMLDLTNVQVVGKEAEIK